MSVISHALEEIRIAKAQRSYSELEDLLYDNAIEVLKVLSEQGHSGFSAYAIIDLVKRLWLYGILTPLTGEDDEWEKIGQDLYQNKRCSAVFRNNGEAHYTKGYAYCEPNSDVWFIGTYSSKVVTFPCKPEELQTQTEYRKLLFPSKIIPIKWANKLHLYRKVK